MRRLNDDERGLALVFVAIVLVLLFAFAGFAVDAGAMFQERRELRNGADAAALAVAEQCVSGELTCDGSNDEAEARPTAEFYADLNADDGKSGVDSIRIMRPGDVGWLPEYDGYDLIARVVTSSERNDGSAGFDFWFMRVVGLDSTIVRAAATAAVEDTGIPPMVISYCDWEKLLVAGQTKTPYAVKVQGGGTDDCSWVAGHDDNDDERLPGGFGWLIQETYPTSQCAAKDPVEDEAGLWWVDGWTGTAPSTECRLKFPAIFPDPDGGVAPFLIYQDLVFESGERRYDLWGAADLHITGFRLPGLSGGNTYGLCGNWNCLVGYFEGSTYPPSQLSEAERKEVRLIE